MVSKKVRELRKQKFLEICGQERQVVRMYKRRRDWEAVLARATLSLLVDYQRWSRLMKKYDGDLLKLKRYFSPSFYDFVVKNMNEPELKVLYYEDKDNILKYPYLKPI